MDIIGSFDNIESVTKIETRYYKKIMLAKYSTQQQFFIYTTLRHVWDIHYTSTFDFIRGCEWLKLLHIPGFDTYLFMLLNISPLLPKNYYNYVVFTVNDCALCAGMQWIWDFQESWGKGWGGKAKNCRFTLSLPAYNIQYLGPALNQGLGNSPAWHDIGWHRSRLGTSWAWHGFGWHRYRLYTSDLCTSQTWHGIVWHQSRLGTLVRERGLLVYWS